MSNKKIKHLEERIEAVESAQVNEIDTLSSAIKDIYIAMDKLIQQNRDMDATLAAIRYLLIAKKYLGAEEIESKRVKVVEAINAAIEKLNNKQESPVDPNLTPIESELEVIHKAAAEAGKTPYPDEAFIFGG